MNVQGWPTPWTVQNDRCVLCGHVLAHTAAEAALATCSAEPGQTQHLELVGKDDAFGHTFRLHFGPSTLEDGGSSGHYVILHVKPTDEYPRGVAAQRPQARPPMPGLFVLGGEAQ